MTHHFAQSGAHWQEVFTAPQHFADQFRALQHLSHVGLWELRLPENAVMWSRELFNILGLKPENFNGHPDTYLTVVHPDDIHKVIDHFEAAKRGETVPPLEHRIIRPNGELRHVSASAKRVKNEANETETLLYGTIQDITDKKQAEEKVRLLANRLTAVLESITDSFFTLDRDWVFTYANSVAKRTIGKSVNELLGQILWQAIPKTVGGTFERELRRALEEGRPVVFEDFDPYLEKWWEIRAYPSEGGLAIYAADITERRRTQDELRKNEERFQYVAQAISDAIWDWDIINMRAWCSENMEALFGYVCPESADPLEVWARQVHPEDKDRVLREFDAALKGSANSLCIEYRFPHHGGTYIDVLSRSVIVRDSNGKAVRMVGALVDITERKRAEAARKANEEKIRYLAFHDSLTGLANRVLLSERVRNMLDRHDRQHSGAVLLLDLDDFKALNDTFGHDTGDQLLKQVAERLTYCADKCATVARLGGDEFVILLEDLPGEDRAEARNHARMLAERIIAVFRLPFILKEHHNYFVTPSIGITLFSQSQETAEDILKRADLAMYQAKAAGRNTLRFFDPDMEAAVAARVALEGDMREALMNNQFELHYQPQFTCEGKLVGAEALLRWPHPARGPVSPAKFIPLAENTGLIMPLGQWVLTAACTLLKRWSAIPECAGLSIAVNVSALQLRSAGFVEQVLAILEQTGADPRKLKIELTESVLVDNVEDSIAKMMVLKSRGLGFSLDDFGTGYSSLSYLKLLPLDQLKIDQSFVRDIETDQNDAAIACAIIALGHSLGLSVIAEGVENEGQRHFLDHHGCPAHQGYLLSPPLPADQLEKLIKTWHANAGASRRTPDSAHG